MTKIIVSLLENGSFEVVGSQGEAVRVWNDDEGTENRSWVIVKKAGEGDEWERLWEFNSLDSALNSAVYEAKGEENVPFEVRMPNGMSFKRPGVKTAEEVLASAGWYFMSELIGFVMLTMPSDKNQFEVREEFSKMVPGEEVRLGEVNVADEDDKGKYWVADFSLDFRGWLHLDEVHNFAAEGFSDLGLDVLPFFDYRPRTNIAASEAIVLEFPKDRMVRAA